MVGTITVEPEKAYEVKLKGKDLVLITELLEQRPYSQVKTIIEDISEQLKEKLKDK